MFKFCFATIIAISFFSVSHANTALTISLEKPFGSAWYDLEHFSSFRSSNGVDARSMVRSELNFPLDPIRMSLSFASYRQAGPNEPTLYRSQAGIWAAISPSFSDMRDEDWFGVNASENLSESTVLVKFSDTYSTQKSYMTGGGVSRDFTQMDFFGERYIIGMGVSGQFAFFNIFGLKGKQLGGYGEMQSVSLPKHLNVVSYLTYSVAPSIQVQPLSNFLNLKWDADFYPIVYTHSFDDHKIRKKHITMDSWGLGGKLETSLPISRPGFETSKISPLSPYIKMETIRTWGTMKQRYYEDSPDSPEDETGVSFDGLSTKVNHWLIGIGIHYKLLFN